MTVPVFMRRDQVPEGHEWQEDDGGAWWPIGLSARSAAQWVRVRPVAATPPVDLRQIVREEMNIAESFGGVERVGADAIADRVAERALNGGVLRPADPTGPPADTLHWRCACGMQNGIQYSDCAVCAQPRPVGSPVPAYKDEPEWVRISAAVMRWVESGAWVYGVTSVGEARLLDPNRWDYASTGCEQWLSVSLMSDSLPDDLPVVVRRTEEDQ